MSFAAAKHTFVQSTSSVFANRKEKKKKKNVIAFSPHQKTQKKNLIVSAEATKQAHEGIAEAHESTLATMRMTSRNSSSSSSSSSSGTYAHEGIAEAHESSLASMRLAPARDANTATTSRPSSKADEKDALYFSATCPFCHKIWITMLEKNISFDGFVWEDLENKSEAFCKTFATGSPDAEANPSVPVLRLPNGKVMVESALVMNYFCCNDTYPGVDLRPKTAEQRYDGQLFENTFNTVVPAFFKCLRAKNEAELESAISEVEHALAKADRCLQMNASFGGDNGNYCCGNQFTSHDCATMGFLSRLRVVLKHYRDYDLNNTLQKLPWLKSWADAVEKRPSLLKTYELVPGIVGKSSVDEAYIAHFAKFVSWSSAI
jgi:glutathione S-transferase